MRERKTKDAADKAEELRIFICIEVPASIKQRIDDLQQDLKEISAPMSWTRSDNVHLTIKFLGNVKASRLPKIAAACERAAAGLAEFEIEVTGAGCFPSARAPRVLWIGLNDASDSLNKIHEQIENELAGEGFEREGRRFSPHLTIGRARDPRKAGPAAEKLVAMGFEPERFEAREIIVMRSQLSPKGSIYTPQAIIRLGGMDD
jgi:RNA 2',3'-cyclic 3'-phosphodiesterase